MKYGSVYTPDNLADYVVSALSQFINEDKLGSFGVCLDPACGGFSLLEAIHRSNKQYDHLIGIDFDPDAINLSKKTVQKFDIDATIVEKDFLLPSKRMRSASYWTRQIGAVDTIIANPPWSSDRIYKKDDLCQHGFSLASGQYDSYFLFIELALSILKRNGYAAFILPDSLFSGTAKPLREHLLKKYQIKLIARLGEKLFEGVFRSTTLLIIKNTTPEPQSPVSCFRLSPSDRADVLAGRTLLYNIYRSKSHVVPQRHFLMSEDFLFDIDSSTLDLTIIEKIKAASDLSWSRELSFGRGVEISKAGTVFICPKCGLANSTSRPDEPTKRTCQHCKAASIVTSNNIIPLISSTPHEQSVPVAVGESVGRYLINIDRYLSLHVNGVSYKSPSIYTKPKLLIRKTGLGIKAAVDLDEVYTTQSVYFFYNSISDSHDVDRLSFYMALLNSRTIFYFYMKLYGENEWKSHPYLTKRVLENLPLITFDPSNTAHATIARLARGLVNDYSTSLDLHIEGLIRALYCLNNTDIERITCELRNLPNLQALKEMKL